MTKYECLREIFTDCKVRAGNAFYQKDLIKRIKGGISQIIREYIFTKIPLFLK